ncbi:alpha/beta hydrolase [Paenibacillus methanolicus]|uniref:Pimeloyl-ACP methyl ester carboxylesterase n=1 Tax=Paenibacillus methanolicus TaxID=582686 RepID=A0A5S5BP80_9BACL|nr:pimeloyl-ACP methyl ester carboxylesterase [Paenibacillus methanolicus]
MRIFKKRISWKRLILAIIPLFLLPASGFVYEWIASERAQSAYPMPGKLVDAGTFRLHMNISRSAGPTIIFEAGSGETSLSWRSIPNDLAPYATVVSYDRAGYGWSEPSPDPRTGDNIVRELHHALSQAGLTGPYILVGHSLGGMYMRLFAQSYPEETAALVLVDAREENNERESLAVLTSESIPEQPSPSLLTLLKRSGIMRLFQDELLEGFVPKEDRGIFINIVATSAFFNAKATEANLASLTENAIRGQSLGSIPLRVIARGIPEDGRQYGLSEAAGAELELIWQNGQRRQLALSSDSRLIIAEKSGHDVMRTEPKLIVDVIKSLFP